MSRNWFLLKRDYSRWTKEEFTECLAECNHMIAEAHKKGRKDWKAYKKELLQKMEEFGIQPSCEETSADTKDIGKRPLAETEHTGKDKTRVMYIEFKGGSLTGQGRIGRVQFSKTGKTIYYDGRKLQSLKGNGYKANYIDVETGTEFWISGCKRKGDDTLYAGIIEIDNDVREEYWRDIRKEPQNAHLSSFRSEGKYSKRKPK